MTPLSWAIVLLFVGLVFLVLEFFIPSGGALGVMCALSFFAAIIVGFMAGPATGAAILLAECVIVPSAVGAAVRWWPDTAIGKLMLIQRPRSADEVLPETVAYRGLKELIGRRGRAKGLMVPSGSVVIDGKLYDAVSEGLPIEANQAVIVVSISMQRLVVRADNTIQAQLAEEPAVAVAPRPTDANGPLVDDIPDPFAEEPT